MLAALAPVLLFLFGASASVGWVRNPLPVLQTILYGLVAAVALSRSRFRVRQAFAIGLALSAGLVLLSAGRVLPGPAEILGRSAIETLTFMNARIWTFLGDLGRGIGNLRSGSSAGAAVSTVVYALLAWQTVYWLVWASLRHQAAWPALFLGFALLAARDVLSFRPPAWSMGMTFAGLIFAASAIYAARIDSWERRGIGYPMLIWEGWAASLVVVSLIVFLVTGLTTPQWRGEIQRFLDSIQDRRPSTGPSLAPEGRAPRPSFVPDLGLVGAPFPLGDETVFYVRTSDAPIEAESGGLWDPPAEQHYWRAAIYQDYTGRGWELAPEGDAASSSSLVPSAGAFRVPLRQEFTILDPGDSRRFAASQPVVASESLVLLTVGEDRSSLLRGSESVYSVVSWVPRVTRVQLAAAGSEYPDSVREAYLQVPDDLPHRVRDLAAKVADEAASPFETAERIEAFLRTTHPYQDDVPPPPPNRDVVDYFLFDAPGGFCSYYASAMVVLLRLEGVPSRVVTGFASGDWQRREARYRVSESHAHAWVEVYFPEYGWIEFEPTPSRAVFEYPDASAAALDTGPAATDDEAGLRSGVAPAAAGTMAAFAATALLIAAFAWRRRSRATADRTVHDLYWQMRRMATGDGRPHLTPFEFAARHEAALAGLPRLQFAARSLMPLYVQATYTPRAPAPWETEEARRAWRAAWWDRVRLGWRTKGSQPPGSAPRGS